MATLNPALKDFWKTKARNRILYGGRASSKSWDAAGVAICMAQQCKLRILCCRQFQNKITESVYTLLKIQIERFGLQDEFYITDKSIKHKRTGSEFLFYGLWRNIDEVKSLEGIDICWIEEAHNLTSVQWEILEPTVRKEGSQFWIIFNPRLANDFVYKRFVRNPPPDTLVRMINYPDNPFLSSTVLKVIEAAKDEDYDEFMHQYMGVPRDNDDTAVIKRTWIQSAIDAHLTIKPINGSWVGGKTSGYDVADCGGDSNALSIIDGSTLVHLEEWYAAEDELVKSSARVLSVSNDYNVSHIGYDPIGVGAGTGSNLTNMGFRKHFKFNAAGAISSPDKFYDKLSKVKNKDYFSNLKAQGWWLLADRFRNTHNALHSGGKFKADQMISLSSKCDSKLLEKLMDELCTPKRDFDNVGKVKVESKKDLANRDVVSPNLADSLIIAANRGLVASLGNVKDML